MSVTKKVVLCAVCVALCCVLPLALHALYLGKMLSPMHLPVLLCGVLCGGGYGMLCGAVGPVLSSLLCSMPQAAGLISMVPELMVYGLISGVMMRSLRTGKLYLDIYSALLSAMILGRIVGGIASALLCIGTEKSFTVAIWVSTYFIGTLPGILSQMVLIPLLVTALMRAGVIPRRYRDKCNSNTEK